MTDHDFKAFRRRRRDRPQTAEPDTAAAPTTGSTVDAIAEPSEPSALSDAPGRPVPQAAAIDRPRKTAASGAVFAEPPQLPAHLPELWERIAQVPSAAGSGPQDGMGRGAGRHTGPLLPLVSRFRQDPAAKAFDLLRTRLLHTLKARGWRRVAVTAPTAGCGTTFSAVNLALSLARVPGCRTLLMDMNFRRPAVAAALGIDGGNWDQAGFLGGRIAPEDHLRRPVPGLAAALNSQPGSDAAEILHDAHCAATLASVVEDSRADAVLFDLPPVLEHDDTAAFLPQVDAVLLISDGTATTAAQLAACEKMLAGHTQLLGVVLNRARRATGPLG